jgi:HSP20 family molecular chaperone IbpA
MDTSAPQQTSTESAPKRRGVRPWLWVLLLVVIGVTAWTQWGGEEASEKRAARAELDALLGSEAPSEPEFSFPSFRFRSMEQELEESLREMRQIQAEAQRELSEARGFFQLPMTQDVGVNETRDAYVITVPLAHEADAEQVKVEAAGQRVKISGKMTMMSADGQHPVGTTQFFKTFTAPQPLDTHKIERVLKETPQGQTLVITLPKKHSNTAPSLPPSARPTPQEPKETPPPPLNPREIERHLPPPDTFI